MTNAEICREARVADVERLLPLCRAFCEYFDYRFSEPEQRKVVREFIAEPDLGRMFLIQDKSEAVGYAALTFSFSLEYGGRTAFIDELFIGATGRGRGLGKRVLAFLEGACREMGIKALLLEAEDTNPRAAALYENAGYAFLGRRLMTRVLDASRGYK